MGKQIWVALLMALALAAGCSHEEARPSKAAKESTGKRETTPLETAPAASAPAPDKTSKAVTAAIDNWAQAWEKQNVDAYLAAYSPSFKPEKGSRKSWAKQRRERITKAKNVKVTVGNPVVTMSGPNQATAKFKQFYESDSHSDQSMKTLELEKVDGKWLITRERSS